MNKINDKDYKVLTPFKGWVLENFPFIEADFDAITNYELYCKIVEYLNNVIYNQNQVQDLGSELVAGYNDVVDYVNNYFNNLDVQEEINNKLDQLVADGTLTQLIGNYVNPLIEQQNTLIENLQQQINNVVTNPPKAVDSTSDMTDQDQIYILTTDGKWYYYDTTNSQWIAGGDYQSTSFNDLIQIKPATINIQGYLSTSGYINTTSGFMRSDYIPVLDGKTYITGQLISPSSPILLVAGYDTDKNLIYKG